MNRSLGGITLGVGSRRISLCIVGVVVYQVTLCSVRSCQKVLGEYRGGRMTAPRDLRVARQARRPAT